MRYSYGMCTGSGMARYGVGLLLVWTWYFLGMAFARYSTVMLLACCWYGIVLVRHGIVLAWYWHGVGMVSVLGWRGIGAVWV